MKLIKTNEEFNPSPFLTVPIDRTLVETLPFTDFDKDGYEVPAPLEHLHYQAQEVNLNTEIQYHIAPVQPWYIDETLSEKGLVLDHCMLLTRWAFNGAARQQLEEVSKTRPILNKLLGIRPKWGIDFSLDWIDHDICMEVIHIEQDFYTIEQALDAKQRLEHIIETTDWYQGAQDLIRRKNKWQDLSSDDHSDYKAQYFGWHRAFDNKKVFSI
jgi:hypothetical protein